MSYELPNDHFCHRSCFVRPVTLTQCRRLGRVIKQDIEYFLHELQSTTTTFVCWSNCLSDGMVLQGFLNLINECVI